MKKFKFYLILLAVLSLVLVGCGNSSETAEDDLKQANTDVAALKTDQSVMLFSTLSSASVLNQSAPVINSLSSVQPLFGEEPQEEAPIDMKKANSYLLMMENILADGGPIVSSESASDRDGYDLMMVVSVKDLAGNVSSYTIYYSIIVEEVLPEDVPVEEELPADENNEEINPDAQSISYRYSYKEHGDVESDNDEEDVESKNHQYEDKHHHNHEKAEDQFKHHEHGNDDEEIEYDIVALAVIDDVEYEVTGKKEVEVEDDEEEVEIEFKVQLDENNYVKIEQEIEGDEAEYKYVVYRDGKKYSSLSFESEEENGKTHIKLTTTENGYKETYKFIKDENRTIIKYDSNGYSYTLIVTSKIDEETNELVYEYKVKEKEFNWEFRKDNKHGKH